MNTEIVTPLYDEAVSLLKKMIATPSYSGDEGGTAALIEQYFTRKSIPTHRLENNVWAINKHFDETRPTILLNSHHDTVKANKNYINNPFDAMEIADRLYGLGSNDAGGSLVALIAVFTHFYDRADLKYNLVIAASAEEEISGVKGISALLPHLPIIDFGIVGEPTQMHMAVAEKGLLVLDCTTEGVPGHAARDEGDNAIYKAMKDIEWFRGFSFPKVSELLGPVKMSVTMINAGSQHNVVPGTCTFTVDCRLNEHYTHEAFLDTVRQHVISEVVPRSMRLRATSISLDHPVVVAGISLGLSHYGSPTLSDKALMPFPSLKIGPGDSARSHIADEYIYLDEIKQGIDIYINLLNKLL